MKQNSDIVHTFGFLSLFLLRLLCPDYSDMDDCYVKDKKGVY